jgi:RNA polymerase sigma factor (sigma-70 family)
MSGDSSDPLPPLIALVSAIQAGDEHAIGIFIKHYEPPLRRVLRVTKVIRLLQSQMDSQDVVQSVLFQVIQDIQAQRVRFEDMRDLECYLKKVGRNRLHDHIRRQKAAKRDRRRTIGGEAGALSQVARAGPSPSQIAEIREQVARVEACASPSELQLIKEHADGTGWKQLAEARDVSPEALRKRIERVRQRIRQTLAETGSETSSENP